MSCLSCGGSIPDDECDRDAIVERAKLCIEGKSRSYVEDAKVFAQWIIKRVEENRGAES
jgi:hypothetical protein